MKDLAEALLAAEEALAAGSLGLEGLEKACTDAQELYERLIVLRHKARETAVAGGSKEEREEKKPGGGADLSTPIKLDTRPGDVHPGQTSLIDAIEGLGTAGPAPPKRKESAPEAERPAAPPAAPAPERPDKKPTLAEKLEKAPVQSLARSISLSQKFWFVSELYNGDRIHYEKSIERIDRMSGRDEAEVYVRTEVIAQLKKPADPEAINKFMELLERRFQ